MTEDWYNVHRYLHSLLPQTIHSLKMKRVSHQHSKSLGTKEDSNVICLSSNLNTNVVVRVVVRGEQHKNKRGSFDSLNTNVVVHGVPQAGEC